MSVLCESSRPHRALLAQARIGELCPECLRGASSSARDFKLELKEGASMVDIYWIAIWHNEVSRMLLAGIEQCLASVCYGSVTKTND